MSVGGVSPIPGRCGFFVERKRRFCKMIVRTGNSYCGEHADVENGNSRRRIPCPLDPKHTVFEEQLSKHLQKCNSREKPKPVYYEQNINAGSGDEETSEDQVLALGHRSKAALDSHLEKLKAAAKAFGEKLEDSILSHPVLTEQLHDPNNGDSALKHLKQQASILGNMEEIGLLGSNRCFVEFGAGKGKLSHWIREAVKGHNDHHFLLVERSSTRFKVDGKHQQADGRFERLQVDIQHLDLGRVPLLMETRVRLVGVGKHLCGSATDLALRCLFEGVASETAPPCKRSRYQEEPAPPSHHPAPPSPRPAPPSPHPAPPSRADVCGVAIALCCHHRCAWRPYVGKQFFRENGLGASEFAAFRRMSSWATCNGCPDDQSRDHDGDVEPSDKDILNGVLSAEERGRVGRLCKRLIDHGRVCYLQSKGFMTKLQYYTTPQTTLENVLLTAVPPQPADDEESTRGASRE
ncbi:tRNA:m(4)X modification enzyme TRM13 homolog isoform X1 [Gadus morhua]|uniref:tRNA:m(4)X modification enzyme TRM13 homolog isoform X1 n=1 Tax=Gadus morhua TaxID=8049 RepID=UPI0011B7DC23|nr:tRNA:m(4)X modification enzyme TRM13 homolog isoform X1 [Gadus morhua]